MQADEGIFLMGEADSTEINIEQVPTNLLKKLTGILPYSIPAGSIGWKLETFRRATRMFPLKFIKRC